MALCSAWLMLGREGGKEATPFPSTSRLLSCWDSGPSSGYTGLTWAQFREQNLHTPLPGDKRGSWAVGSNQEPYSTAYEHSQLCPSHSAPWGWHLRGSFTGQTLSQYLPRYHSPPALCHCPLPLLLLRIHPSLPFSQHWPSLRWGCSE